MYTIHLGFSRDVSFQMQYVKFCSISSYNTHSLLHVVSINLWLKKFTENVYTCSTDQGIKQCYTGYIQLIYYSQRHTICTFRYQWVFFQSNTHIVSCAVRTRPCLLLTCFRFIRVLQKLIMKLELNICHLHVLKTSRFKLQCKAIFPKTFALFINHIFIFDK